MLLPKSAADLIATARLNSAMFTTTVIVPTFNRAQFLHETLDAVLRQTRPVDEVIVVNDGSTDATSEVLRSYGDAVSLFRTSNRGKSAAVNFGLSVAKKDWIWIVDDDDVPCPDAHQRLVDVLRSRCEARFAYGRHDRFYTVDGAIRRLDTGYWSNCPDEEFHLATMEDYFAHQGGMLVAREVYETVGVFDETLHSSEDYEMLVRIACAFTGARCEGVVLRQRLHRGYRGPSEDRFDANEREPRWIRTDQKLFAKFRSVLPLEIYVPRGTKLSEPEDARRALLQRGCIMARKKLWAEAILDFETAADVHSGTLTDEERSILRRTTCSKYGCNELIESPDIVRSLIVFGRRSRQSADITRSIARGLVWRIREAALEGRLAYAGSLLLVAMRLSASGIGRRRIPISHRLYRRVRTRT
jgi:glycosyltransferase involved in cell wall biosynthesis